MISAPFATTRAVLPSELRKATLSRPAMPDVEPIRRPPGEDCCCTQLSLWLPASATLGGEAHRARATGYELDGIPRSLVRSP